MIELIFVIVILGILAAVAVPKLTATRDDAELTKFAANAKQLIKDIIVYYTAHGTFATSNGGGNAKYDISKMSNVPLTDVSNTRGVASLAFKGVACLEITLNQTEKTIKIAEPLESNGNSKLTAENRNLCNKVYKSPLLVDQIVVLQQDKSTILRDGKIISLKNSATF